MVSTRDLIFVVYLSLISQFTDLQMDSPLESVSQCPDDSSQKQSSASGASDLKFLDSIRDLITSRGSDKGFDWRNEHIWRGNNKTKPSLTGAQSTISTAGKSVLSCPSLCSKTTLGTYSEQQDEGYSTYQRMSRHEFMDAGMSTFACDHPTLDLPRVPIPQHSPIITGARNEELSKQIMLICSMNATTEIPRLREYIPALLNDPFLRDLDSLRQRISTKLEPGEENDGEEAQLKFGDPEEALKPRTNTYWTPLTVYGKKYDKDEESEYDDDDDEYEDEDEDDLSSYYSTTNSCALLHPSTESFVASFQSEGDLTESEPCQLCASCLGLTGVHKNHLLSGISPGSSRDYTVHATNSSGANSSSSSSPSTLSSNGGGTRAQQSSISKRRRPDQENEGEYPERNDGDQKRPGKLKTAY
ncbi:hypothetical protein PT974_07597 [Cladobotryum mycophilum]|uniref:Uncharacterized protein n=1 Tax=Cladobotryum mycophilum TaxID=491253 RepID=A0ABR0SQW6_9HYPO